MNEREIEHQDSFRRMFRIPVAACLDAIVEMQDQFPDDPDWNPEVEEAINRSLNAVCDEVY